MSDPQEARDRLIKDARRARIEWAVSTSGQSVDAAVVDALLASDDVLAAKGLTFESAYPCQPCGCMSDEYEAALDAMSEAVTSGGGIAGALDALIAHGWGPRVFPSSEEKR